MGTAIRGLARRRAQKQVQASIEMEIAVLCQLLCQLVASDWSIRIQMSNSITAEYLTTPTHSQSFQLVLHNESWEFIESVSYGCACENLPGER